MISVKGPSEVGTKGNKVWPLIGSPTSIRCNLFQCLLNGECCWMRREHRRVESCCSNRSVDLAPDDSRNRFFVQSNRSRFPDAFDANRSRHLARPPRTALRNPIVLDRFRAVVSSWHVECSTIHRVVPVVSLTRKSERRRLFYPSILRAI